MRHRSIHRISLIVLFIVLAAGLATWAWAECQTYPNNHSIWVAGYGTYCGGTGGSCTECTNQGGDHCTTDGSSCEPQPYVKPE